MTKSIITKFLGLFFFCAMAFTFPSSFAEANIVYGESDGIQYFYDPDEDFQYDDGSRYSDYCDVTPYDIIANDSNHNIVFVERRMKWGGSFLSNGGSAGNAETLIDPEYSGEEFCIEPGNCYTWRPSGVLRAKRVNPPRRGHALWRITVKFENGTVLSSGWHDWCTVNYSVNDNDIVPIDEPSKTHKMNHRTDEYYQYVANKYFKNVAPAFL